MNRLQRVAFGEDDADLVVRGGRVFLPGGGQLVDRDVAVVGERIAALPEDADAVVGEDTTVVDATDMVVTPGFVDAHCHQDFIQTTEYAYPRMLEGGTTSIVTEVGGYGTALGAEGVNAFLEATADLPVSVYGTVPPVPLFDTFEDRINPDLQSTLLPALLDRERVVGVGEVGWIHVVGRDTPAAILFQRANRLDKPVGGHGSGAGDENLDAFAQVVDNDHESLSGEDHVARVRDGLHSIARSGSVRDDAPALADALAQLDTDHFSLGTDGVWPAALLEEGHMDAVLRRAVDAGIAPLDAIRMATETTADHFSLHRRGRLAPGHAADIVVLADLESMAVETVVADGQVVVTDGTADADPRPHNYPERVVNSVRVTLEDDSFAVPTDVAPDGRVRAVGIRDLLLTEAVTVEPPVENDEYVADPEADLLKAACLNRHPDGAGEAFTGFVADFGLETGAVATTLTWELPSLVVLGTNDDDMRQATEHLRFTGGGYAVVEAGDVRADLAAPVAAVAADQPVAETAAKMDAVTDALRDLGVTHDRPLLALQGITFPGVPALRLSYSGYADILARERRGLAPA